MLVFKNAGNGDPSFSTMEIRGGLAYYDERGRETGPTDGLQIFLIKNHRRITNIILNRKQIAALRDNLNTFLARHDAEVEDEGAVNMIVGEL